jgi:uncharacterized CHY-type Zn-finger protein
MHNIDVRPTRTTRAPTTDPRFDVPLRGVEVGPATRCAHYHGERDVIALRFACCDVFYPCYRCHAACAEHAPERWGPGQLNTPGVLCGACSTVLSLQSYLDADHECPACGAAFNPGCARHHDRYVQVE